MDQRYSVFLHLESLEVLPKRGTQTGSIIRFIRSLADDPFKTGDFSAKDASFRTRQIKVIGDYAITFWADHPAKCVMVVDIKLADR